MAEWRELALGLGRGLQQGGALFAQLYPQAKVGQYNAAVDQQRYRGELARLMEERQYGRNRDAIADERYNAGLDYQKQQDANRQHENTMSRLFDMQKYADEQNKPAKADTWRPSTFEEYLINDPNFKRLTLDDQMKKLFDYKSRISGTTPAGKVDPINTSVEDNAFGQFYDEYMRSTGREYDSGDKVYYQTEGSWNPFSIPPFKQKINVPPVAQDSALTYSLGKLNKLRGQNAQMQGFSFGQPQKQTTDTTSFDPSKLSDEELMRIISGGQ